MVFFFEIDGGQKNPPLVIFQLEGDLAVSTDTSKRPKAQKKITGESKRKPKTRRKKTKWRGRLATEPNRNPWRPTSQVASSAEQLVPPLTMNHNKA